MIRPFLPPFRPGGLLSRETLRGLNAVGQALNTQAAFTGTGGQLIANAGPLGTSLRDVTPNYRMVTWYGVLVDRGPNPASTDYPDGRYWVRSVRFRQTQGASMADSVAAYMDASVLNSDGTYGGALWVTATSLAEAQSATHTLPVLSATTSTTTALPATATLVRVWQIEASKTTERTDDWGNTVYIFEPVAGAASGSGAVVTVKITGNALRNSVFVGRTLTPPKTPFVDAAGNLEEADLGTPATTDNCYVFGLPEVGMEPMGHHFTGAVNAATFSRYVIGRVDHIAANGWLVIHAETYFARCESAGA